MTIADGGFWTLPCPARGPGLTHVHDKQCDSGHAIGQCCFCGASMLLTSMAQAQQAMARRLKEMGLMSVTPLNDDPPEERDETLVEPKMVTGNGPQGQNWSRNFGRFYRGVAELTEQDKRRLKFYVFAVRLGHD
jgi:hypothetical protein